MDIESILFIWQKIIIIGGYANSLSKYLTDYFLELRFDEQKQKDFDSKCNSAEFITKIEQLDDLNATMAEWSEKLLDAMGVENIDFEKTFQEKDINEFSVIELKPKLNIREDACDWTTFKFDECLESFLKIKIFINELKKLANQINNSIILQLLVPVEESVEQLITKMEDYL